MSTGSKNLRLIVHADDFGLSDGINSGIARAHEEGIVTSASIMPTAPATIDAIGLAKSLPSLDIGIHLTLVEERPALEPDRVPSLVGADGRFLGHAKLFAARYLLRKIRLDEVREELDAQIQHILDREVSVSHLDSHQHVHLFPGIFRIVASLAIKHRIPAIRLPRERIRLYMFDSLSSVKRVSELAILNVLSRSARDSGLLSTDTFAGFVHGGRLNQKNLQTVLANLPESGTCELMCHPADVDARSPHSQWKYNGTDELQALTSAATRDYLSDRDVRLISYRDLK